MSAFVVFQVLSYAVALGGIGLQVVYYVATMKDRAARLRDQRHDMERERAGLPRRRPPHEWEAQVNVVTGRLISAVALGLIHLGVVVTTSFVIHAAGPNPSATAWIVSSGRPWTSLMVISATGGQFLVRAKARRLLAAAEQ